MANVRRPALVTGGARRLGRAIVERLAADGNPVVIHHHRSGDEAAALARSIRQLGGEAWTTKADLRDERSVAGLVAEATRLAGEPPGILVNSASLFASSTFASTSWHGLEESLRLHHWAPMCLMLAFASGGAQGAVINVLDATPPLHDRDHVAYQVGKRALLDLTRLAALELAPAVRVNAVAPGAVLAPEGSREGYLDEVASRLPLRRPGNPEAIAQAVSYLANATFVTGTILHVDGGASLLHGAGA